MIEFKYRPDIDGLRAVAVMLVLFFHAGLGFPGGYIGVDVFFVISGFLITGLILKQQEAGKFSLRQFWERRIRRIIPVSAFVVFVTLAAGSLLLMPSDLEDLANSTIAQQLMMSNVYFWNSTGYFEGPADLKPLLHTWSLAVEEQFYLGYPVLLLLFKRATKRVLLSTLLLLGAVSFLISVWGVNEHPSATYYLLPTRAWELLVGAVLVFLPPPTAIKAKYRFLLSLAGITSVFGSALLYSPLTRFPGAMALPPCLGAAAIIYANAATPTGVGRWLSLKPFVFVGLLSYSLYLWHWPILAFLRYWVDQPLHPGTGAIALVLTFFLSYGSWRFVEAPFRSGAKSIRNIVAYPGLGIAFGVMLIASYYIATSKGLPGRFSDNVLRMAENNLPAGYESVRSNNYLLTVEEAERGELPPLGTNESVESPSFLIWGDSHLFSAATLCNKLAEENAIRGAIASHGGFPPLLDAWCIGRDKDEIIRWNRTIREYIHRRKIQNVILVARWSVYIEGELNGHQYMVIEDGVAPSSLSAEAIGDFERSLRRTVSSLEAEGVKVWIMKQVPLQIFDPIRRTQLAAMLGTDKPTSSSLQWNLERHKHSNSIIDRLASDNVRVLDPNPYCFDSDGLSLIFDGNRSLYKDSNHLSRTGAEVLLRPLLAPVFSEIADRVQSAEQVGNPSHATVSTPSQNVPAKVSE